MGSSVGYAACVLSPQPYPPESYDASDAYYGPNKDVALGMTDATPDAGAEPPDGSPTPNNDGGGDGATDAPTDDGSMTDGAASDAESDASDDAHVD